MKHLKLSMILLVAGALRLSAQGTDYNDFIPVGPAPLDYKITDGRLFSELSFDEKNNEQVINLLPNEIQTKSIIRIDKTGKMKITPMELSEKDMNYVVKTDYIKYTTLPVRIGSSTGEIVGIARVGVGVRVEVTLRTKATNINVTDLYRLGATVGPKTLQGNIVMSIMGIESEEVTNPFPVNAEISPSTVAASLQVMTLVKQAIYDVDTHLTPQVLEIKYTDQFAQSATSVSSLTMPILLENKGEPCVVIRGQQ